MQNDYEKPLTHVHFRAEGDMEFRTLLYIPERAPPNFLNDYYGHKAQLKLYVRRVFISDDFEELIPRHAPHMPLPLRPALTSCWLKTGLLMYSTCHAISACSPRMLVTISHRSTSCGSSQVPSLFWHGGRHDPLGALSRW